MSVRQAEMRAELVYNKEWLLLENLGNLAIVFLIEDEEWRIHFKRGTENRD